MNVSVIIPTHNRSQVLLRCLTALIEQRQDVPGSLEIVVVDDGSTDGTAEAVNRFSEGCPVELRLVRLDSQRGPAAARNRGITAARSPTVIFIGDDIIPQPGFLRQHCSVHRRFRGGNIAVLGHTTWHPELEITPFMRWLEASGTQFDYGYVTRYGPTWQHFYTSNISLKRRFMLENGVFDEEFKHAAMEDTELGFRLFSRGLKIIYCRDALAYHLHLGIEPMEYFRDGIFRRGFYEVLFQWKHRRIAEFFDRDTAYWRRVLLSAAMPDQCPSIDHLRLAASAKDRLSRLVAEHFGGSVYESLGSFYRARGAAAKLAERFPNLAVAGEHVARALDAERGGDFEKAVEDFLAARDAEPELLGLVVLCADAFFRWERFEEAERLLRDALEMSPGHPYVNLRMGDLLRRFGRDAAGARDCYVAALAGEMLDAGSRSVAEIGLGLLAVQEGKPKESLGWFERAYSIDVPDPDLRALALKECGGAHFALGDRETAIRLVRQAQSVEGIQRTTRARVALLEAEIMRKGGKFLEALQLLSHLKGKCDGDHQLLSEMELQMGQVEMERGKRKRAQGHFERVASMGASSRLVVEANLALAEALIDQGRLDEAQARLSAVQVEKHAQPEMLARRDGIEGVILMHRRKYDEALRALGRAREETNRGELRNWIDLNMCRCFLMLGRLNEAVAVHSALAESAGLPDEFATEVAFLGGQLHQKQGRLERAAEHFVRALELASPDSAQAGWARFSLAEVLVGQGRAEDAVAHLREIASRSVFSELVVCAAERLGWLYFERSEFETSFQQFEAALKALSPGKRGSERRARIELGMLRCLYNLGRLGDAARVARRLARRVKDRPLSREVAFESGIVAQRRGQHRAAVNRFRKAVQLSHTTAEAGWSRYCLADSLLALGKTAEALSQLREVVSSGGPAELLSASEARMGSLLLQQRRFDAALDAFERAVAGAKDSQMRGWVLFSAGLCLKELGRREDAVGYFARAQGLLSDPEMLASSVWEHVQLSSGEKGQESTAGVFSERILSLAMKGQCTQEIALAALELLHRDGSFKQASGLLKSLSKVIDLDSRFWRLALAYKRRGLLTNAEDMMSSLEFLPASEQAEWHLSAASLLLEMGYDQDAEDEIRSALALRPDWPYANYVLGSILENRRRLDEAKARFEAVLSLRDRVAEDQRSRLIGGAHYHLACILKQEGQTDEALSHLEACVKIAPKHRKAMDLMESLTSTRTLVPS